MATSGTPQERGSLTTVISTLKASREGTASQPGGSADPDRGGSVRPPPR